MINLPKQFGLALGTRYALIPYKWFPFGAKSDFLINPNFINKSQISERKKERKKVYLLL